MKFILTLVLLFIGLSTTAQIGVMTIGKNDIVPLNMWYTIDEKGRENNLYITFKQENDLIDFLQKILTENGMDWEEPAGKDVDGDNYWTVYQENGFISDVYYHPTPEYGSYTMIVVSYPNE
jgi:hypothetical protein